MAIQKVCIKNFKGIEEETDLDIKPITVFIGPNSSGKSSFMHAIACLSQTVKLPNNRRHLILDDEYAYVHLGRFIEAIHSKVYQDEISLGINLGEKEYFTFSESDEKGKPVKKTGELTGIYSFKCSKRTQEIFLNSAKLSIGDHEYNVKKVNETYTIKEKATSKTIQEIHFIPGLAFDFYPFKEDDYFMYPLIQIQQLIKSELLNTFYLGPFRQAPQRNYPTRGANPSEVGALGESTISLLAMETIQSRTRGHISQISNWLNKLGLAKNVDVNRMSRSDLFNVTLTLLDDKKFPIADLGYGISQVLPVLTQCSFATNNSTLLFEQPELHLHLIADRGLASVFIDTMKMKKAKLLQNLA